MFLPKKITLCGSTRFATAFDEWNAKLTLAGHLVYSIAIAVHGKQVSEDQKRRLDWVHLEKIKESDGILVLDVGGYIGDSTRNEIEFAKANGKTITFLSQIGDGIALD